jgi:hypothetical protein
MNQASQIEITQALIDQLNAEGYQVPTLNQVTAIIEAHPEMTIVVEEAVEDFQLTVNEVFTNTEDGNQRSKTRRIKNAISFFNSDLNIISQESSEGAEMTQAYFRKYGIKDYKACAEANDFKVNSGVKQTFLACNGVQIRPLQYIRKIGFAFGMKEKDADCLALWQKFAGIEIATYPKMDKAYFNNHGKADYEACKKANGTVSTDRTIEFLTANSNERIKPLKYIGRLKEIYGLKL